MKCESDCVTHHYAQIFGLFFAVNIRIIRLEGVFNLYFFSYRTSLHLLSLNFILFVSAQMCF